MAETTMDRALGRLEGKLDALMKATEEADRRSIESRTKTYTRLEEISSRTASLESEQRALRADVDSFKPFMMKAERWQERIIGVALAFSTMGALFGGAFVAFKDNVLRLFGGPS